MIQNHRAQHTPARVSSLARESSSLATRAPPRRRRNPPSSTSEPHCSSRLASRSRVDRRALARRHVASSSLALALARVVELVVHVVEFALGETSRDGKARRRGRHVRRRALSQATTVDGSHRHRARDRGEGIEASETARGGSRDVGTPRRRRRVEETTTRERRGGGRGGTDTRRRWWERR